MSAIISYDANVASSNELLVNDVKFKGLDGLWNFRVIYPTMEVREITVSKHPAKRNDWALQPTGYRIKGHVPPKDLMQPTEADLCDVVNVAREELAAYTTRCKAFQEANRGAYGT